MKKTRAAKLTIVCTQCKRPAAVTSVDYEVVELDPEDCDGMSDGQLADYDGEMEMGGGGNWTARVETATCLHCEVTLVRRSLNGIETVSVFSSCPVAKKIRQSR